MPIILPFILQAVLPVITIIFALLVPVLAAVIKFTLTRIPKIPSYILLIKVLYSDIDSSAKERKIITGGLLLIGSILSFMAYSLIPWTGVPLIGAVTSPIAGAIALVVALAILDSIFTMNKGYYLQQLRKKGFAGLDDIETDINSLKNIFGKSWQKVATTINESTQKIYEEGSNKGVNFQDKSFQNYLNHELEGLNVYLGQASVNEYQGLNLDFLNQNKDTAWTKEALSFGTGATVGTLAGVGTSTVASSVFVQASIWTSVQGLFGVSTGVVVSASTYSLLTLAAPVGLGVLATVGIYSGLKDRKNKEEAAKMSKFLSEIFIAALPMAWIDGELADQEQDTVERLMTTSGIRKEERELIWKAIKERQTFDEIMRTSILFDDEHRKKTCSQSNNERLKHRLLLCTAWEMAIADDKIEWSELQLHNRMADKLGISRDEVKEIRRVVNLKHERELWQVAEELKQNGSKTKILKSVREQYYLQPAADNL
ncbi:TerB family tellurite resistance protein [Coleofasciculus sp. FACHB-SPT9]|uniref:tellurite resistance TerB family protein n=1 Tax=Cyanophyceae TaxID=3028117 RepID=UPI00168874EF|nr:TerB family tellurite resistance protein [Coleofasciculus sp. FACHB-SPT9]MBD1892947.1 TerB family tellurite resistance protein [Coleofasciculus sp. FACHB-SPT9]